MNSTQRKHDALEPNVVGEGAECAGDRSAEPFHLHRPHTLDHRDKAKSLKPGMWRG